jgi:hypothetical protein
MSEFEVIYGKDIPREKIVKIEKSDDTILNGLIMEIAETQLQERENILDEKSKSASPKKKSIKVNRKAKPTTMARVQKKLP